MGEDNGWVYIATNAWPKFAVDRNILNARPLNSYPLAFIAG
jgi:hypothetical protein